MYSNIQRDSSLKEFINSRLSDNGMFQLDGVVVETLSCVMAKTALGLLFHEFGRIVPLSKITLLGIEHAHNIEPSAFVEINRRDDAGFAEVTPSGRELERQVIALFGSGPPPYMPEWRIYIPEFFEYMFVRRTTGTLLTAMKLHDALTVLVECTWPSKAGPRRGAHPPRRI